MTATVILGPPSLVFDDDAISFTDGRETITTREGAWLLGVRSATVSRWCNHWYGRPGSGRRFRLTVVDVLVCTAWLRINDGGGTRPAGVLQQLRDDADRAIRHTPARWLASSVGWTDTFSHAEYAAVAYGLLPRPRPACAFYDLGTRP